MQSITFSIITYILEEYTLLLAQ